MRPRALWTNGSFWTSPIKIGAHHYARLFVENGWDVAFVSDPISPFHFVKFTTFKETRERLGTWLSNGRLDLDGHLFHYTPFTLLPHFDLPVLRSPWVLDHWHQLTIPRLRRLMIRQGFDRPDLLVLDSVNQGFWLDVLQPKTSLMRIADDLSGFAGVTPSMLRREKELLGRVDLVAYTAKRLAAKIEACHPRAMLHLPNGCELNHFLYGDATEPDELKTIPRPRALYVGAIDEWFDVELLADVASAMPHVSFVIVGPPRINLGRLKSAANLHILGGRPYAEIPRYMKNADVGLIPFRVTEMIRSVHPIKLYEYMACGLPVAAVSWDELQTLNSPALLCQSAHEFTEAIASCVGESASQESKQALIDFAKRADWRNRFELLAKNLDVARATSHANQPSVV